MLSIFKKGGGIKIDIYKSGKWSGSYTHTFSGSYVENADNLLLNGSGRLTVNGVSVGDKIGVEFDASVAGYAIENFMNINFGTQGKNNHILICQFSESLADNNFISKITSGTALSIFPNASQTMKIKRIWIEK